MVGSAASNTRLAVDHKREPRRQDYFDLVHDPATGYHLSPKKSAFSVKDSQFAVCLRTRRSSRCSGDYRTSCSVCRMVLNTVPSIGIVDEGSLRLFLRGITRSGKNGYGSLTRQVLKYLFDMCNRYEGNAFPSLRAIAMVFKSSVRQVSRIIKRLVSIGLLGKEYRHKKTSLYTLSPEVKFLLAEHFYRFKKNNVYLNTVGIYNYNNRVVATDGSVRADLMASSLLSHSDLFKKRVEKEMFLDDTCSNALYDDVAFSLCGSSPQDIQKKENSCSNEDDATDSLNSFFIKKMNEVEVGIVQSGDDCSMKNVNETRFPAYISDITSINLTDYGRLCLMGMPEEAIREVDANLKKSKQSSLSDAYVYFVAACRQYCSDHDLTIDYRLIKIAEESHDSHEPRVVNNTVNRSMAVPAKKKGDLKSLISKQCEVLKKISQRGGTHISAEERESIPSLGNMASENQYYDEFIETAEGKFCIEIERKSVKYHGLTYNRFLNSELGSMYMSGLTPFFRSLLDPVKNRKVHIEQDGCNDSVNSSVDMVQQTIG